MKYIQSIVILFWASMSFSQAIQGELLGTWSDSTLVPSTAHDNTYNEVWGITANGREIAILGSSFGTHFIDVTNPTQPIEIHRIKGGTAGAQIIHRDFHDYKNYLYCVADEGSQSSLQIIDLSQLPESVTVVYDDNSLLQRSHNIFIDESSAKLYSLSSKGASIGFESMRIFDITDPLSPSLVGEYDQFGGVNFNHVHDAFVRNDTAYLNLGYAGFGIVEFNDFDNPNIISVLEPSEYPQSGYNHSGWLSNDGRFYYMSDETFGKDMKVLDLRSLPDVDVPSTFNSESGNSASIPHNQIVHNGKLYVSYYFDGLQVYDLADPINPQRIMHYPTSTIEHKNGIYRGAWGVYPFFESGNILVSDMQNGLFIVKDIDVTSSTEDYLKGVEMTIAPNPSSGPISIEIKGLNKSSYCITNTAGQVVKEGQFSGEKSTIQVNLPIGIYTFTVMDSPQIQSKRIVIQ